MIKKRSPVAIILFTLITFGIYGIVWIFKTKQELVEEGADIPTAWLTLIPLVNIYFLWKYSTGSAQVFGKDENTGILYFVLWLFIGLVAMIITQIELNKLA